MREFSLGLLNPSVDLGQDQWRSTVVGKEALKLGLLLRGVWRDPVALNVVLVQEVRHESDGAGLRG